MAESSVSTKRPVNLDLKSIRLPLPGIVSILHRVSGAGLFLFLPLLLALLQASLASPESYAGVRETLTNPLVKVVVLGLVWAFLHHAVAGIRFLLLDVHKGLELSAARMSSKIVLVVSLLLTLLVGVRIW